MTAEPAPLRSEPRRLDSSDRRTRQASPVVWVPHPVRDIDLSKATQHGTIRYIVPDGGYLFADQVNDQHLPPARMRDAMNTAVLEFDPHNDHLLVVGDHAQLVLLTARLAMRYDSFMILRYDRFQQDYFPIRVSVDD